MSVIYEEESDLSSDCSEVTDDIDELLRQARALLDENKVVFNDKRALRDKEENVLHEIIQKLGDDEDFEELLRQARALLEDSTLYDIRRKELRDQENELMERLRRRKQKNEDDSDDDDLEQLLRQARLLLENQSMYDTRLSENERQRRDLIERLQKRKRKSGAEDTDDTDIDELLRQARALLDDQSLKNQRLREIREQNEDLMDKIKRRNRQKKGKSEESDKEADDQDTQLEEYLRQARQMLEDNSLLNQRQQELNQQDKDLNDRIRERNRKRQGKKNMFAQLVDKILDSPNLYDDSELEELLRQARSLLNETDLINGRQSEIRAQQENLLDRMRKRKEARQQERNNDPENEKTYLEDIEELMQKARELTLDQRRAATRLQEIEAQQAALTEKMKRRRKGKNIEENDDDIARLLSEAEDLLQDKKLIRLEQDEILHNSDSYKDWLDSKISKKRMGISGDDLDYYLKMAQEIINDQQMVSQQKLEIGVQQGELMEKLARRRGKKMEKMGTDEEARRRAELKDQRFELGKKGVDLEDLDDMIRCAKEMIEDQQLLSNMQLEINLQQNDLNQKLAQRKRRKSAKSQDEISILLDQAKTLLNTQNDLNNKIKTSEQDQLSLLANIRKHEQSDEGLAEALADAESLLKKQSELTNNRDDQNSKLINNVVDQKQKFSSKKIFNQIKLKIVNKFRGQDLTSLLKRTNSILHNREIEFQRTFELEQQQLSLRDRISKRASRRANRIEKYAAIMKSESFLDNEEEFKAQIMDQNLKSAKIQDIRMKEALGQSIMTKTKAEVRKVKKGSILKEQPIQVLQQIEEQPIKILQKETKQKSNTNSKRNTPDIQRHVNDQILEQDSEMMAKLNQIQQEYILDFTIGMNNGGTIQDGSQDSEAREEVEEKMVSSYTNLKKTTNQFVGAPQKGNQQFGQLDIGRPSKVTTKTLTNFPKIQKNDLEAQIQKSSPKKLLH